MLEAQKQNLYLQTQVNTASKPELTLMLYNGCIRFMKQAGLSIDQKDIPGKIENIRRAQAIINELIVTLNMNYDISNRLRMHYDFVNRKLIEANIKSDKESLQFCITHITELRDTWMQAMKNVKMQAQSGV